MLSCFLGQAEVSQDDLNAIRVPSSHEDVGRFDVAMSDVVLMKVHKTREALLENASDLGSRQCLMIVQRSAAAVFQLGYWDVAIVSKLDVKFQQLDDVLLVEA